MRKLFVFVLGLALLAPAHATASPGFETGTCEIPDGAPVPGSGNVVRVPQDWPTIKQASYYLNEGDTLLISPGVYKEQVYIDTPGVRIRGSDRNTVILDGESTRSYAFDVRADRVVIENMTAHNYTNTAFYWEGVTGYWGRYLTAYNTAFYGLYAFDARCGQFDHSYGSGNGDSAFYIGQCFPCDAVITDVTAEENGLGYSGTNAGGNLTLRDSVWRNNGLGIVPNTLEGEARPPQRGATILRNVVEDNNGRTVPGEGLTGQYFGGGIVIAGGQNNTVAGNTVTGHELGGIVLSPLPDPTPWMPAGNVIWGNTVHGPEGTIDLAQAAASGANNCWADNDFDTSAPAEIETIWNCGFVTTPPGGDPRVEHSLVLGAAGLNGREPGDWATWPAPGSQPNQPDDDGDADYANDGAVDTWLPALL